MQRLNSLIFARCLPEKVDDWEIGCEVGGGPGCDGLFAQGYCGDLSGRRGEIDEEGVVEGEAGGFVGGDFVVDQDGVAFAGEVALGAGY